MATYMSKNDPRLFKVYPVLETIAAELFILVLFIVLIELHTLGL